MLARLKALGLLGPTIMTLVMLPVLLGLGTWQWQRKAWKDGLQQVIDTRRVAQPVSWRDALALRATGADVEYLRVQLRGRFEHDSERHLYWPLPEGLGWQIITPFVPDDGSPTVLVNRGWVPDALKAPATRAPGQINTTVTVVGLLRGPETPGRFTPANEPIKNIWFWRDLQAMRQASPPIPGSKAEGVDLVVDAEPLPATPGGWPRGGTTAIRLSNRHLEYAFTWYALAATLSGIFFVFARSRVAAAAPLAE